MELSEQGTLKTGNLHWLEGFCCRRVRTGPRFKPQPKPSTKVLIPQGLLRGMALSLRRRPNHQRTSSEFLPIPNKSATTFKPKPRSKKVATLTRDTLPGLALPSAPLSFFTCCDAWMKGSPSILNRNVVVLQVCSGSVAAAAAKRAAPAACPRPLLLRRRLQLQGRDDAVEKGGDYIFQNQKIQRLTSHWFRWNIDG